MAKVVLMVLDGMLATPGDAVKDALTRQYVLRDREGIVVVRQYDAGDVDVFQWPLNAYWLAKDWEADLARALFDAREMGYFGSDVDEAELPDGRSVSF